MDWQDEYQILFNIDGLLISLVLLEIFGFWESWRFEGRHNIFGKTVHLWENNLLKSGKPSF